MTNNIHISGIITTLLCLFFLTPCHAVVYKWVDQDGQVHYGDQTNNTSAERMTIRNNQTIKPRTINKAETDGDGNTETKNPEAEKQRDKNRENAARMPVNSEEPVLSTKEKIRLCNEAKSDIAAITSRGRMRERNAKGEYSYLSENQRQQRLSAARKKQREFCRY